MSTRAKKNATVTPKLGAAKATTASSSKATAVNNPNKTKTKCDLCLATIVDDKEDALQCEGTCQLWFHRYCAGVSQSLFKSLANDDKPFVCLHCSQERHHVTVNELQSEVVALRAEVAELRAVLEAFRSNGENINAIALLRKEVEQLKMQPSCDREAEPAQPKLAQQSSRSTNSKVPRSRWVQVSTSTKKTSNGQNQTNKSSSLHHSNNGQASKKDRVPGVRKVWGCLKTCTSQTLATTIARLCPDMNGRLQVRRKFVTNKDGKTSKWWFLIKGDEPALTELEKSWECISVQTSWKLQDCFKFTLPGQSLEQEAPYDETIHPVSIPTPATSITGTPLMSMPPQKSEGTNN